MHAVLGRLHARWGSAHGRTGTWPLLSGNDALQATRCNVLHMQASFNDAAKHRILYDAAKHRMSSYAAPSRPPCHLQVRLRYSAGGDWGPARHCVEGWQLALDRLGCSGCQRCCLPCTLLATLGLAQCCVAVVGVLGNLHAGRHIKLVCKSTCGYCAGPV